MLGVRILRSVEYLGQQLPDVCVVLVVVAEVIIELAGEDCAEHGQHVAVRPVLRCDQPHPPQPLYGGVVEWAVGTLV